MGNDNVCVVLLDGPGASFPAHALASAVTRVLILVQPIRGLLGRLNSAHGDLEGDGHGRDSLDEAVHAESKYGGGEKGTRRTARQGGVRASNFEVFRVTVLTLADLPTFGPFGSGSGLPQPLQRMVLEGMPRAMHECLAMHAAPPGYTASEECLDASRMGRHQLGGRVALNGGGSSQSQQSPGPQSVPLGLGRLAAAG